MELEASNG